MPIYLGDKEIVTEYVDGYQLGEIFLGTTLVQANNTSNQFIRATGGSITLDGDYKIHTFTTTGTSSFQIISTGTIPNNSLQYLVVAGGGGGGIGHTADGGGSGGAGIGGGAGGVLTGSLIPTSSGAFNVIVGEGGVGAVSGISNSTSGKISSALGIVANSGSGATGTDATSGNGFIRGANSFTTAAPGGGGASENGYASSNNVGGNGGNGIASSISGVSTYYGGGGGGNPPNSGQGLGGLGGGGNSGGSGQNGTANTGGGGGGGASGLDNVGGNGGSGIVILRYKYK